MNVLFQLFLLLQLCLTGCSPEKLLCFHCISQIPLSHLDIEEINAFKVYMFSKYNIPPSNKFCDDSKHFDFFKIPTEECEFSDECVTTRIRSKDLTLVIRGCLSKLFKEGFSLNRTVSCNSSENSACFCNSRLCNFSAPKSFLIVIMFLLAYI